MKIVIAGASGLVGSALRPKLKAAGHEVFQLVRGRPPREPDEIGWAPEHGRIDRGALEGTNVWINLAGVNLGERRWTEARRRAILESRVNATRTLVSAIGSLARRPSLLVNASAVGYYGDRGDEVLTESSAIGRGFLPEVCRAWEREAEHAESHGVRCVRARFGIILAQNGGALAKMLPLFRAGLGGRLGSGQQWMSWIAIADVIGVFQHVIADPRCKGPINVVAPAAVTNQEFAAMLAEILRRPAIFPVPRWALRLALGRGIADEALLSSTRAAPQCLSETGFHFRHSTLSSALEAVLGAGKL